MLECIMMKKILQQYQIIIRVLVPFSKHKIIGDFSQLDICILLLQHF